MLRLDASPALTFLDDDALDQIQPELRAAHQALVGGTGEGSDALGWREMLLNPNDALLDDLETTAARIRDNADVLICIGIGGSYLGAEAVISALTPYFGDTGTRVVFAGHQMSGVYLRELLASLDGQSVYVNVISKSGTTLEPALAFRVVRAWMEERFDDAERPHRGHDRSGAGRARRVAQGERLQEVRHPPERRRAVLGLDARRPVADRRCGHRHPQLVLRRRRTLPETRRARRSKATR